MLEVKSLTCERGDRRLFNDLSFALNAGDLLYVEGANGSGKTTLLRALCGLFLPQAGEILWNGENTTSLDEDYWRDVIYLGHLNGIKDDLSGFESLKLAAVLDGDAVTDADIVAALERLGLANYIDLPTRLLSQGQKRRVVLARLLMSKATMWILDEPFTALDAAAIDILKQVVSQHIQAGGMVVLTTHQATDLPDIPVQHLKLGG